jgi:hypothetical protein
MTESSNFFAFELVITILEGSYVLHWNENVDRKYTSIWKSKNPNAPTSQRGKKVYKELTYNYRKSIWKSYIASFY